MLSIYIFCIYWNKLQLEVNVVAPKAYSYNVVVQFDIREKNVTLVKASGNLIRLSKKILFEEVKVLSTSKKSSITESKNLCYKVRLSSKRRVVIVHFSLRK